MQRRLIEIQRLAIIRHPVVLHSDGGEVGGGAHNLHSKCSLQISRRDSQSRRTAVNDAESTKIGKDRAPNGCAMRVLSKSVNG